MFQLQPEWCNHYNCNDTRLPNWLSLYCRIRSQCPKPKMNAFLDHYKFHGFFRMPMKLQKSELSVTKLNRTHCITNVFPNLDVLRITTSITTGHKLSWLLRSQRSQYFGQIRMCELLTQYGLHGKNFLVKLNVVCKQNDLTSFSLMCYILFQDKLKFGQLRNPEYGHLWVTLSLECNQTMEFGYLLRHWKEIDKLASIIDLSISAIERKNEKV